MNVMMVCMMAFLASCSKDSDVTEPAPAPVPDTDSVVTKPTTYTVMLYGCGGGDLDNALSYNLDQVEALGKQSRVNFTALVKFSQTLQSKTESQGTRLLTLTKDGMQNEKKYEATYRLDNPEHLANFIKESKEKMPADKYILVFWNHGSAFGSADKQVQDSYPEGQTPSRGALSDDNTATTMSTFEMEKGIKDSGTKLDLVYFDVCLMGMAETFCQLKDCSKYIMAASHTTPGLGGNYTKLISELQENDSLTDAVKAYVPAAVTNWKNAGEQVADLSCFDMQYMDEFTQNMKAATTEVLRLKKEQTEIPEADKDDDAKLLARNNWFGKTQFGEGFGGIIYPFFRGYASVDLCSLLTRLASTYLDGTLSSCATQVRSTLEKMTVANASFGLPQWMDRVSMGITWPVAAFIERSDSYEQAMRSSAFCKATGWDKILYDTDNPEMSYFESAFFDNTYNYVEGAQPSYAYLCDVTLSVDESAVIPTVLEVVKGQVEEINEKAAKNLADMKYPLMFMEEVAHDLYNYVSYYYAPAWTVCGVDNIKVTVKLKDGETVNPNDRDASEYGTTFEKMYGLSGVIRY